MNFIRVIKSDIKVTRDMLEKAIEEYVDKAVVSDILKQFKSINIGQGWGYKKDGEWKSFSNDEIIYIPEGGYSDGDWGGSSRISDYPINSDLLYTKQDFINIVGNDRARQLFEDVDWQSPETLAYEYDWQTDYNEIGRNAPEGFKPNYDKDGNYIP